MTAARILFSLFLIMLPLQAMACGAARISSHPSIPPWSWLDGDRIDGVGIQITRTVLDRMGITNEAVYLGSWSRVLKLGETGHLDFVPNVFRTEERAGWLHYQASPYQSDDAVVFSRRGDLAHIRELGDLVGLKGGSTLGDSWGAAFDRFLDSQSVERAPTANSLIRMLAHGRIDYAVYAAISGRAVATSIGLSDKVHSHPSPLASEGMYIGISKRSACAAIAGPFEAELERYLAELRANGGMRALIDHQIDQWAKSTRP